MRQPLKDLIHSAILFKYKLPNSLIDINRSKISTDDDSCYSSISNESLAEIIYNAVIDYAFNEYEITEQDFDTLHRRALTRKLKFNEQVEDAQKLKYGFYGEVILYCMLYIFYKASPLIARGHLYQVLENGETKGYDAYHLIDNNGQLELWFGEVKFYASFKEAVTGKNGAITNLTKAIKDDYLNKNLIAISERVNDLAIKNSPLKQVLDDIKNNPDIKISDISKKYSIKLVYPILILFDEGKEGYDQTISQVIQHIEDKTEEIVFSLSIEISLFFTFIPVANTSAIKLKVLEWIKEKKSLLS